MLSYSAPREIKPCPSYWLPYTLLLKKIYNIIHTYTLKAFLQRDTIVLVSKADLLFDLARSLRGLAAVKALTCLDCTVMEDSPGHLNRFLVSYVLDAPALSFKFVLSAYVPSYGVLYSLGTFLPGVSWLELEASEMFGLTFISSNTGSRRILTDYGFRGFPLKKDFPVTGWRELSFIPALGTIVNVSSGRTAVFSRYARHLLGSNSIKAANL